jgi:hypothetical protein
MVKSMLMNAKGCLGDDEKWKKSNNVVRIKFMLQCN